MTGNSYTVVLVVVVVVVVVVTLPFLWRAEGRLCPPGTKDGGMAADSGRGSRGFESRVVRGASIVETTTSLRGVVVKESPYPPVPGVGTPELPPAKVGVEELLGA